MRQEARGGSVVATQRVLLRRSVRGLWPHLPLLTLGSAAVCLSAALAALVAPGLTPLAVPITAILVAPSATALGAVANTVVGEDDSSYSVWRGAWQIGVRRGISVMLPPAMTGALFLVAVQVWQRTGQPVVLASVGVSGAVTVCLVPVSSAMVQAVTNLPQLSLAAQWRIAAELVLRWPVRFVAAPVLLGLGIWLGTQLSVSLLLLVPAPVALVGAAAFWTSAVETGRLTFEPSPENVSLERNSV